MRNKIATRRKRTSGLFFVIDYYNGLCRIFCANCYKKLRIRLLFFGGFTVYDIFGKDKKAMQDFKFKTQDFLQNIKTHVINGGRKKNEWKSFFFIGCDKSGF